PRPPPRPHPVLCELVQIRTSALPRSRWRHANHVDEQARNAEPFAEDPLELRSGQGAPLERTPHLPVVGGPLLRAEVPPVRSQPPLALKPPDPDDERPVVPL